MDERLTQALKTANRNNVFQTQKKLTLERMAIDRQISMGGATFSASVELLSYLGNKVNNMEEDDFLFLESVNGTPCRFTMNEAVELLYRLDFAYEAALSTAWEEIERLKKARTVDGMTSV